MFGLNYITGGAIVVLAVSNAFTLYAWRGAKLDLAGERLAFSEYRLDISQATEREANRRNADALVRMRNNERIQDEDQRREQALAHERAAVAVTVAGLRDTVASLNNRAVPGDSGAAAYAREASAARSALEQCGERYQWVDGEAKKLASQVVGLQHFVVDVCKAGSHGD